MNCGRRMRCSRFRPRSRIRLWHGSTSSGPPNRLRRSRGRSDANSAMTCSRRWHKSVLPACAKVWRRSNRRVSFMQIRGSVCRATRSSMRSCRRPPITVCCAAGRDLHERIAEALETRFADGARRAGAGCAPLDRGRPDRARCRRLARRGTARKSALGISRSDRPPSARAATHLPARGRYGAA